MTDMNALWDSVQDGLGDAQDIHLDKAQQSKDCGRSRIKTMMMNGDKRHQDRKSGSRPSSS